MNWNRVLINAAALAMSPLCAVGLHAQTGDYQIVYGQRVGPISLGMSAAQVLQIKGTPPGTMSAPKGGMTVRYSDLTLSFDENLRVVRIYVGSSQYVTTDGLHLGDSTFVLRVKRPNFSWRRNVNPGNESFCYPDGTYFETDPQKGVIIDIALNACTP
jgi:hypothetical protein